MKIKNIQVKGMNQRLSGRIEFFEDINVLTGANGSGKTTLLKACWYLISGNIRKAFEEIEFQEISIETDISAIRVSRDETNREDPTYEIEIVRAVIGNFDIDKFLEPQGRQLSGKWTEIESQIWRYGLVMSIAHSSLFFPTFRRVEGGFSVGPKVKGLRDLRGAQLGIPEDDELTKALRTISSKLTEFDNKFICSVSTTDVEALVAETAARMTASQKEKYEALAQRISSQIREWQSTGSSTDESSQQLTQILQDVTDTEAKRNQITEPIELLGSEIAQFFKGKSIAIGKSDFGKGAIKIDAASLSAGEKQLISFLCYATFYTNYLFMVDEPELSLHLDWQRKLVGSLQSLGPSNQYFFVTHSPAIYTKFSDKEISIDQLLEVSQ